MIVQDVGIARLIKQISPDTQVHGSTQMSLTSAEGIRLAQQFGVSRVVLARELSLEDIRAIRAATDCELEMFVHGALCVSYSGQCFSSEAWGGRSANRGQCAQACRLPYELMVDGRFQPTGDARYLLSPGDLYALHQIPDIITTGISALKIEGRYKDANYVALTTSAYRKAVDEAWSGLPLSINPREELQLEQVYSRGLGPHFITGTNHQTVVKGRSPRHRGVLMGRVARIDTGTASVIVAPAAANALSPIKPGDGLVFDAADWRSPQEAEEGGRVYEVNAAQRGQVQLRFATNAIQFNRIRVGDLVWRSDDPELEKVARPFTQANSPVHRQPLDVRVEAYVGAPLLTVWTVVDHPDVRVSVSSTEPLVAARGQTVSKELVREQLGRLGHTAYELADVVLDARGGPFVSNSLLNQLRRQAVELLVERQGRSRPIITHDPQQALDALSTHTSSAVQLRMEPMRSALTQVPPAAALPKESVNSVSTDIPPAVAPRIEPVSSMSTHVPPAVALRIEPVRSVSTDVPSAVALPMKRVSSVPAAVALPINREGGVPAVVALPMKQVNSVPAAVVQPHLHILVRTPEQLAAAIAQRPASITLDYLELYGLRPAVEQVQAAGITARVASPRILKPNEQRIVQFLPRLNADILVRSSGLLSALRDLHVTLPELIGDFSLNTANIITAETFLDLGLKRLTPTHDLNAAQIARLAEALGADQLEVVAYHHLPVFHTEHCVFCRFLSQGTSYKDCGHPCETHRIALRDVNGRTHPVMADVGCRNTVFGAEAQEASRHLDAWLRAGIRHFRIEFAHESAEQVEQVSRAWADALCGRSSARDLSRRLQTGAPQGTTEGSLFIPESALTVR
jgi:collagenase-like PrtC family protease